jgi:hypothetical protein
MGHNINDPKQNLEIDPEINSRLNAGMQAPVALDPTERAFYQSTGEGRGRRAQAIRNARKANKQAPVKLED